MSEHNFETVVGYEIDITVYFDFSPAEEETRIDPGWPAKVDITAVRVDGIVNQDIQYVLSDTVLDALKMECWDELNEGES